MIEFISSSVSTDIKSFVVPATQEELQQTVKNVFSSMNSGGADFANAAAAMSNALGSWGLNLEFIDAWYSAMKALRDAAQAGSESSSSEMEELKKLAEEFANASESFANSQKGLENYKTDQNKINDPFYAEFYAIFNPYIEFIPKVAIYSEYVDMFFSQRNAEVIAKLAVIFGTISQRAYALETA